MIRRLGAATVVAATLTITACTGDKSSDTSNLEPSSQQQSARPPIAVTVGPAPAQPGKSGRVAGYDSCTQIGDDVVTALGFDAASRHRADFVFDHYSFIGCEFDRMEDVRGQQLRVGSLTLWSSTLSLDELRERPDFLAKRELTVNGREAFGHRLEDDPACNIAMPGPDGVFVVKVSSSAALTKWVACEHIEEAAQAVEAVLPPVK
ncbi:DUF3558 family protein [Nocardia sp. IBHARD005]|uniref:DUF3558 family protein n=1 Tax=Nocardia sp. IBHARD005 TaxID=3457765 RepID=UPI0040581899